MLASFGVFQVVISMLWFFLFFVWIMLLFRIFADIFRSDDLSGIAKVAWIVFLVLFIYVGAFAYLIARGGKMAEREARNVAAQQQAAQDYIRQAAGTAASPADELARLAQLKADGVIDDAEFAAMKAKVIG
jgi:hypothetical protein